MATTNVMSSSRVLLLLLAATLAAVASVRGQSSPAMAPAPPPSPVAQCTTDYLKGLGLCVDFRLGRADLRGKNLALERERCCREVRGKPSATECLCAAFGLAGVTDPTELAGNVNAVRIVCDLSEVSGLVCPASTSD
jgi:hypothetical protein